MGGGRRRRSGVARQRLHQGPYRPGLEIHDGVRRALRASFIEPQHRIRQKLRLDIIGTEGARAGPLVDGHVPVQFAPRKRSCPPPLQRFLGDFLSRASRRVSVT